MSIIKRERDVWNTLPRLFDDFFTRDLMDWGFKNYSSTGTTIPAVNIQETNDHFDVELAAPGMTKNDFKVELDNNVLTISSEKEDKHEEKDDKYTRREFSYQSFQRSFTLPEQVVDIEKINAKYENGVLHLTVPKKESAKPKPPKTIKIS